MGRYKIHITIFAPIVEAEGGSVAVDVEAELLGGAGHLEEEAELLGAGHLEEEADLKVDQNI
jgi:hypothetical protein